MAIISIIKGLAMVTMFSLTLITGNIPLRMNAFKENQKLLSLTSAFSGGLFISVGLIHLLPESSEKFEKYYEKLQEAEDEKKKSEQKQESPQQQQGDEPNNNPSQQDENSTKKEEEEEEKKDVEHFPFSMLVAVLSFSFVLMIEKVITTNSEHHHHSHNDDHSHQDHENHKHDHHNEEQKNGNLKGKQSHKQQQYQEQSDKQLSDQKKINIIALQEQKLDTPQHSSVNGSPNLTMIGAIGLSSETSNILTNRYKMDQSEIPNGVELMLNQKDSKEISIQNDQIIEIKVNNLDKHHSQKQNEIEKEDEKPSQEKKEQLFRQLSKQMDEKEKGPANALAPYIIQFAFGLHATLEGLAIGVQQELFVCLTIVLAVLAHKWAEGLVIGLAMKKSNIELRRATIMIAIQAIMNPIGIGLGWILSDAGELTSGILMSISAGTFIYIATNEVIVEEFNLDRYKVVKFIIFLIGVGFISSLWLIEQLSGGD